MRFAICFFVCTAHTPLAQTHWLVVWQADEHVRMQEMYDRNFFMEDTEREVWMFLHEKIICIAPGISRTGTPCDVIQPAFFDPPNLTHKFPI